LVSILFITYGYGIYEKHSFESHQESGAAANKINNVLWTYRGVDIDLAQKLAYENNFKAGCRYGVFAGIPIQLANKNMELHTKISLSG
jgi:hypothetical protein